MLHIRHDATPSGRIVPDAVYMNGPRPDLPAGAAQRLVDHDARVGHGVALALGARRQQERAHGRRQAEAVRLHIRAAQLHKTRNTCLSTLQRGCCRTALAYPVSKVTTWMLRGGSSTSARTRNTALHSKDQISYRIHLQTQLRRCQQWVFACLARTQAGSAPAWHRICPCPP